jgi:hypothetical protein
LEILEPRLLLATGQPASITSVVLPPIPVAASDPGAPVTLQLPGGDSTVSPVVVPTGDQQVTGEVGPGDAINVYRITIGPATDSLQLGITWDTPPQVGSAGMVVFDAQGNLPTDETASGVSNSTTVSFSAPVPTTGTSVYLAVEGSGPAGASRTGGDVDFSVWIAYDAPAPTPVSVTAAGHGDGAFATGVVTSSPDGGVVQASAGSGSSSPAQTSPADHGQSAEGPWPSNTTGKETVAAAATSGRIGAQGSARTFASIDVSPLPASPYEPAGGILADGGPAEGGDPVDATSLDLSLVRLPVSASAGWRDVERSSDPDATPSLSSDRDTSLDSPTVLRVRQDPRSSRYARTFQSDEGIAVRRVGVLVVPPPLLAADGSPGESPGVSAVTLPPIDESDRPRSPMPVPSRVEESAIRSDTEWASGRGVAIVLGLSWSAVLGVGLHAPDLAGICRRAFARAVPIRRPRPAASRDDRARR